MNAFLCTIDPDIYSYAKNKSTTTNFGDSIIDVEDNLIVDNKVATFLEYMSVYITSVRY